MAGSFIPQSFEKAYGTYTMLVSTAIQEVFGSKQFNFLDKSILAGLKIMRGDNCLETCFQHKILDSDNEKLLQLKTYDKVMDLVGRDGSHLVGSRIDTVLGSKQ